MLNFLRLPSARRAIVRAASSAGPAVDQPLEQLEGRRMLYGGIEQPMATTLQPFDATVVPAVDRPLDLDAEARRLTQLDIAAEARQEVYPTYSDYVPQATDEPVVMADGLPGGVESLFPDGHEDGFGPITSGDLGGGDDLDALTGGCTCAACCAANGLPHGLPHGLPAFEEVSSSLDEALDLAAAAPFPLDQTFQLQSRPEASRTIYLDFDGHTTTNKVWNQYVGGAAIQTTPYSTDSNRNSFSENDLRGIQEIWEYVSEDFRAFDVNVTTVAQSYNDLYNAGGSDQEWGIRVAIGGDGRQLYPEGGVGGVAFLNSFGDTDWAGPTFVFSDVFGGFARYVAAATSHEVGHTLGLSHDGSADGAYDRGRGANFNRSGFEQGWGPIMGAPYTKEVMQWSRGQYGGATNGEDDLSIISSVQNGTGFIADDHSDSLTSLDAVTRLDVDAEGNVSGGGIISNASDEDGFRFEHGGGALDIDVTVKRPGPNLDSKVTLYEWDGSGWLQRQVDEPDTQLDSGISGVFDEGTYMVRVDGDGWGSPTSSSRTGWTDYGSQGLYTISGTVTPEPIGDTTSPSVTGMWVASSAWQGSFLAGLDPTDGLGYDMGDVLAGDSAGRVLPWSLDRVSLRFDEPVTGSVSTLLIGGNGTPVQVDAYSYEAATQTATFDLATPITQGTFSVAINTTATTDAAGNDANPMNVPLSVLRGDVNGDRRVNARDLLVARGQLGDVLGQDGYDFFADVNADGRINARDLLDIRRLLGDVL